MSIRARLQPALKAAGIHLVFSVAIALLAAWIVFGLWYPYPYRELSGGRELFLLIVVVDVICGPVLTLVLFNQLKPRKELWRDLGLVAVIQIAALLYGVWTVWQARPLYLVLEVDRFKVVMAADVDNSELKKLPPDLSPKLFGGVRVVALRPPLSVEEKNKVLFAALEGGRDYAERPEFYIEYAEGAAHGSLKRAKPIEPFLQKYPEQRTAANQIAEKEGAPLIDLKLLPVAGRQDWVALLDNQGAIKGFLKGDGF